MAFFACKLMWDSTVSYWSPSVGVSVHVAMLPAYHFFAKMALGSG